MIDVSFILSFGIAFVLGTFFGMMLSEAMRDSDKEETDGKD